MAEATSAPILTLRQIDKFFGDINAVERVSLEIQEGEFFTVVGPSGSGKTTLIRLLVGMDKPTNGDILLRGKRINDVPANRRPTCMVFQSLALFPHMTVGQNVEYPLKCRNRPKPERRERALACLKVAHLPESYYDRPVTQCSGGERQRVALARALAFDPEILFFDEPLSAIDFRLRKTLEKELKDIQRETGKTFVYITHSLEEAMVMSDRIAVMRNGRIAQIGTPREIYTSPNSRFVSEFMGEVNTLPVVVDDSGEVVCESLNLRLPLPASLPRDKRSGSLVIRPEDLRFARDGEGLIRGTVFNEYLLGSRVQYQIRVGATTLLVEQLRDTDTAMLRDQSVALTFTPTESMLFLE